MCNYPAYHPSPTLASLRYAKMGRPLRLVGSNHRDAETQRKHCGYYDSMRYAGRAIARLEYVAGYRMKSGQWLNLNETDKYNNDTQ